MYLSYTSLSLPWPGQSSLGTQGHTMLLICLMPFAISALKVLDFESTRNLPLEADLTSAVLSSSQGGNLPDRFILCSSTKQEKVDKKSPYLLYGEDDKPWLTFSFLLADNGVNLWANVRQGSWLQLHSVDKKPWTNAHLGSQSLASPRQFSSCTLPWAYQDRIIA
jgi:hypothetical protein